jgi:hypothetical protein
MVMPLGNGSMQERWVGRARRWAGAILVSVWSTPNAQAEPDLSSEQSEPALHQRNIGLLATVGTFQGFGAGMRLGSPAIGVQGTFGWTFTLQRVTHEDDATEFLFRGGYMASGDVYVRAYESKTHSAAGLLLGYRYFNVLGHGIAVGGYGLLRLHGAVDGFIQGGAILFPDGESRLRRLEQLGNQPDFDWPGPRFTTHLNVGAFLFP